MFFAKSVSKIGNDAGLLSGVAGSNPHIFGILAEAVSSSLIQAVRVEFLKATESNSDTSAGSNPSSEYNPTADYSPNESISLESLNLIDKISNNISTSFNPVSIDDLFITYNSATKQVAIDNLKEFSYVFESPLVDRIPQTLVGLSGYTEEAKIVAADGAVFVVKRIGDGQPADLVKALVPELSFDWGGDGSDVETFKAYYPVGFHLVSGKLIQVGTQPSIGSVFMETTYVDGVNTGIGQTGIVTKVELQDDGSYIITLLEQTSGITQEAADEYGIGAEYIDSDESGVITTTRTVRIYPGDENWLFVSTGTTKNLGATAIADLDLPSVRQDLINNGILRFDSTQSNSPQAIALDDFLKTADGVESWNEKIDAMMAISNVYSLSQGLAPYIVPLIDHATAYLSLDPQDREPYLLELGRQLSAGRQVRISL